jgi:essential nuclear protein 1
MLKLSLPVLHAAAALMKMTEYPYTLGTSYFIKVLMGKNYALPARVIVAMVDYFYKVTQHED